MYDDITKPSHYIWHQLLRLNRETNRLHKRKNKMTTATKVREIENGRQAKYRFDPPITATALGMSMEVTHLISSHSARPGFVGHETLLFPSDGNGGIVSYAELYGERGHVDHDEVVRNFLEENTHEQTPHHTHQPCTHLGTQKSGEKEMTTTIQETIARLRELDQEASPAPWWVGSSAESYNAIVCEDGETTSGVLDACYVGERLSNDDPDLQIITEARNAIPALLAEIERLTAENQALTDQLTEARVAIVPLKENK